MLGVCVVGLILDKTVFRAIDTPAPAHGIEIGYVPTGIRPPGKGESEPIPDLAYPFDVVRFRTANSVLDPFAEPGQEVYAADNVKAVAPGTDTSDSAAAGASSKQFAENHVLSGLVVNEASTFAVLDGTWVRIGESVDGCKLRRITGRNAVFVCQDGEATLTFRHGSDQRN